MKPVNKSDTRLGGTTNQINRGGNAMTESQLAVIINNLNRIVETQQRFMAASVQMVYTGKVTDEYIKAAEDAEETEDGFFLFPNELVSCAASAK